MENQIVWESIQEDIRRSIPKPLIFYRPQRNPNEPPRYLYNKYLFFLKNGNIEEKKHLLLLHKIHVESFPKADLEEKMNRWVQKEFKSFNEEARLSIQHWKDSCIEAHDLYSIVDKPNTGLIYLNSKNEKWVMYLVEIVKFCDATLEKVLKEVKLKIFQSEPWKKPPLLGELDRDIIKAYEKEINKRLRHQEQMRRRESFVNERPILPTMKHL
ncbi:hypothetical protein Tco_0764286 [Tanacetum coccineum]